MKRLQAALMLCCLALPVPAFADDIEAASTIREVTVYSGRAKVTRFASVEIPAGAHTVTFTGLPAMLFADSLRAEGSAKADVKFGAVSHKQVMSSRLTSAREEELSAKIETLQDQINLVQADRAAAEAQRTFLATLAQQGALRQQEDIAEINLKPEQWTGASTAIRDANAEVLKSIIQSDVKLRELNREVQKVQSEMNLLRTDQRSTLSVSVPLESAAAATLKIELSYQIPNASWKPLYDARLTSEGKGDVQLVQFGAVSQQTGEDWTGVKLSLSTAQPQRGASLPDLTPMWVDAYEQGRNFGMLQKSNEMSSNMMRIDQMQMDAVEVESGAAAPAAAPVQMPAEKKAGFAAAEIQTGGFVTEYKIPGPATVLADGSETKLMVGAFKTETSLEIHVKPQIASDAYLVAQIRLKGESPILPGQVNLFRDGAFTGQSYIKLIRPDEEYGMYFGVDDQVSVKRRTLKDEKKEEGVITRDSVLERAYVTEVQNLHTTPIMLVVKETIPAPQNEKVKVALNPDATTEGYKQDSANVKGLLQWEIKMEPKEKKEVKLGWTLGWPKDSQLSGLR